MSVFMGNTGKVLFTDAANPDNVILLHIRAWRFDWTRDGPIDITTFDSDGDWMDQTVGLARITGTLEGFYQDAGDDALVESELITHALKLVLTTSQAPLKTYSWIAADPDPRIELSDFAQATTAGQPPTWTCAFLANSTPVIV